MYGLESGLTRTQECRYIAVSLHSGAQPEICSGAGWQNSRSEWKKS